jgi:hypothetical protein
LTLKNGPEFLASLRKLSEGQKMAARKELRRIGEEIMTAAKLLTPVDTGALRSSGHVQDSFDGGAYTVTLGFGGVAGAGGLRRGRSGRRASAGDQVGYAVKVHEDLYAHHPEGQAKFLEDPLRGETPDILPRIKRAINKAVI